ncbi:hypothetical protein RJ640_020006 [Escallonia rubra]|uniref:Mechanosensitive ion channel protein n=1 Tax=Escallonia rubra TaxID=112253 RepID=A0AA88USW4_9ASTE|nr:hypothetical protein RJ640_020006 [Escallonia rubra]
MDRFLMDRDGEASKTVELSSTSDIKSSSEVAVDICSDERDGQTSSPLPDIVVMGSDSETTSSNKPPKIPARSVKQHSSSGGDEVSISISGTNANHTFEESPKTPLMASPGSAMDDDGETYRGATMQNKSVNWRRWVELLVFVCISGGLISSLTVDKLKNTEIWGLVIWRWCAFVMVTICGLLVTSWFMDFVVWFVKLTYKSKEKLLYFVNVLKKSVQVFIWLSLVLVTWVLLFNSNHGVERTATAKRILGYITWTTASLLIGAFFWLLKTLLLEILVLSFHVYNFFDRIQESISHQYVLQTLSGPPLCKSAELLGRSKSTLPPHLERRKGINEKEKDVTGICNLHNMNLEKFSPWTMTMLVDFISNSRLSCDSDRREGEITNSMEAVAAAYHIFRNIAPPGSRFIDNYDLRQFMTGEEADLVFEWLDGAGQGRIDRKALTDWVSFDRLKSLEEELFVSRVLEQQKGKDKRVYGRDSERNIHSFSKEAQPSIFLLQMKAYNLRKELASSLHRTTKTAVNQLNKLVTGILIVLMIILWLLLMKIATTKVLLFISSQIVVAAFIFGNTCKTVFESIVFVFCMHPFDVGDRCVIDGVQMTVEEINILTTVFLRFDNEQIYYPNSVLATKPISNLQRSPEMSDSLEFTIDFTTPVEKIEVLKKGIARYDFSVCTIFSYKRTQLALRLLHHGIVQDPK